MAIIKLDSSRPTDVANWIPGRRLLPFCRKPGALKRFNLLCRLRIPGFGPKTDGTKRRLSGRKTGTYLRYQGKLFCLGLLKLVEPYGEWKAKNLFGAGSILLGCPLLAHFVKTTLPQFSVEVKVHSRFEGTA
jgi:hypothetical protein